MVSEKQFTDVYSGLNITSWYGEFPTPLEVTDFDVEKENIVKRVIDTTLVLASMFTTEKDKKVSVQFSEEESSASFDGSTVTIGLAPFKYMLPLKDRLYAFFGEFVHEVGHIKFTNPDFAALYDSISTDTTPVDINFKARKIFVNDRLLQNLTNILEDKRIEHLMSVDYPGYNRYLKAMRSSMIATYITCHTESSLEDLNKTLMQYITLYKLYPAYLEAIPGYKEKLESALASEINLKELQDLLNIREATYTEVLDNSKKLEKFFDTESDPMTKAKGESSEPADPHGESKNGEGDLDKITKAIIEAIKSKAIKESIEKAISSGAVPDSPVENIKEDTPRDMKLASDISCGDRYNDVYIWEHFPQATPKRGYENLAREIKASFSTFSATVNKSVVEYEQEEGELDEEDLYQASFNRNVFMTETPVPDSSMEIILLVDLSGSMSGERIANQAYISNAICKAFVGNPKISFKMYGHTANTKYINLEIIPYVDEKHKYDPRVVAGMEAHYNNADGYALQYVLNKFSRRQNANKLVLMLSDGQPCASGYQGSKANEHVRQVVKKAESLGIQVLSIAIGNFDQSSMYDNVIPYEGHNLGKKISQWIRANFRGKAAKITF